MSGYPSGSKGGVSTTDNETLKHIKYNPETNQIESDREIQTTLNSFFLGEQIKLSSGGQNLFVTNLYSQTNFFPAWSGLKDHRIVANRGAGGVITPSIRKYADMQTLEPYGAAAASGSVAYNKAAALLGNHSVLGQTFIVMEPVAEDDWLEYQVWYGTDETGIQAYEQKFTGQAYAIGATVDWWFTHPIEGFTGTPIVTCIKLHKGGEDGEAHYLQVRPSAANSLDHYSNVRLRVFEDKPIEVVVTPNRAIVSDADGEPIASEVTSAELSVLDGGTVDSGAPVSDADRFVHNDNGVMKQTAFSKLWEYIKGKASTNHLAGAVSTIFTNKLTIYRALQSDVNGNVAASEITSTELNYLDGVRSNIQSQLDAKKPTAANVWRMAQGGIVNTNGTVVEAYFLGFTATRTGVGKYTVSSLASSTYSMVNIECLADGDSPYVVYGKSNNSFNVAFYDAPNMAPQDTNFRFSWNVIY